MAVAAIPVRNSSPFLFDSPSRVDTASHPAADAAPAESAQPEESLSFWDLLDVVNPLHHIPVVGSIYRAITGDEIKPAAQVLGGTLFGGVAGYVASLANVLVEARSGKDVGEHMFAMFQGGPTEPTATAVAEASSRAAPSGTVSAAAEPPATVAAAPDSAPQPVSLVPQPQKAARPAEGRAFPVPRRVGEATGKAYPIPARLPGADPAPPSPPAPRAQTAEAAGPNFGPPPAARSSAGSRTTAAASGAKGASAAWPPGGPAPLPKELVADAMMGALDKYQRSANLGARPAPAAVDTRF